MSVREGKLVGLAVNGTTSTPPVRTQLHRALGSLKFDERMTTPDVSLANSRLLCPRAQSPPEPPKFDDEDCATGGAPVRRGRSHIRGRSIGAALGNRKLLLKS